MSCTNACEVDYRLNPAVIYNLYICLLCFSYFSKAATADLQCFSKLETRHVWSSEIYDSEVILNAFYFQVSMTFFTQHFCYQEPMPYLAINGILEF